MSLVQGQVTLVKQEARMGLEGRPGLAGPAVEKKGHYSCHAFPWAGRPSLLFLGRSGRRAAARKTLIVMAL